MVVREIFSLENPTTMPAPRSGRGFGVAEPMAWVCGMDEHMACHRGPREFASCSAGLLFDPCSAPIMFAIELGWPQSANQKKIRSVRKKKAPSWPRSRCTPRDQTPFALATRKRSTGAGRRCCVFMVSDR